MTSRWSAAGSGSSWRPSRTSAWWPRPATAGRRSAREVIALSPGTRVLILTTFDADEYVYEALRGGASGFLLKDAPADQLITAVRSLAAGDALIDPVITRRL